MRIIVFLIWLSIAQSLNAQTPKKGYQGQGPINAINTSSVPIQKQWKGIWALEDSTVFFSNNFNGARLNGVVANGNDHYTVLITAENIPINPSPWYAFKVWSTSDKRVNIRLNFQSSRARYYPKISFNGRDFSPVDSSNYTPINLGEGVFGIKAVPESFEVEVQLSEQPVWIAAQELYNSSTVFEWMDELAQKPYLEVVTVATSMESRPIKTMTLGSEKIKKAVLVITRQHPPEVTGFLAMKSFTERLASDDKLSKKFRKHFTCFFFPLMNPDGVDNGHWRHGAGGVDLNRDWHDFNQPETRAVRDFLDAKKKEGVDFVFGVDFHSTWDDIYYTLDTAMTNNADEMIIYDWINKISDRLPSKQTNVNPSKNPIMPTTVSRNYFYQYYDMPALVFELGDNTPRDFLKEKGKVAAEELMKVLLENRYEN